MEWENSIIREIAWSGDIINQEAKELVALKIAQKARAGEVIGVGSGSTVYLALEALARRMKQEKLQIQVVPASLEATMACIRLGIPVVKLYEQKSDWTFDGADEVDPARNMIKGRGGAMFREKVLIRSSAEVFIMIDNSKLVDHLGEKFPVPVEIFPWAFPYAEQKIKALGAVKIELRPAKGKDGPVITENGNLILDTWFDTISPTLEKELKLITGVIESGLFQNYPVRIAVAD